MTTFVNKSNRVIVRETNNNPLILGPICLHTDASYRAYRSFFAHIAAELEVNIINVIDVRLSKDIQLGSYDEKALAKAVDTTFPDAKGLLCARHLKDNVRHYLPDVACANKDERKAIMKNFLWKTDLYVPRLSPLTGPLFSNHMSSRSTTQRWSQSRTSISSYASKGFDFYLKSCPISNASDFFNNLHLCVAL